MPKPIGGRGKIAPYHTKLVRIPVPVVSQVNQLVERYQDYIAEGGEAINPPQLLDLKPVNSFEQPTELLLSSAGELLNGLRSLNPKSKATLKDVEILLDLLASALETKQV
jgi:hypothetical protein